MEKKINDKFDFYSFQKEQGNYDLKVNINKKREHSVNQLLSLIPGNEFINKKRKKNKNKSINEKSSEREEKDYFKKLYEKRKNLLTKSFTFKESNSFIPTQNIPNKSNIINNKDNSINKEIKTQYFLEEGKNQEIHYALINANNNKFVPDYEPWDKELLEIIFDNSNDLLNKYYSLSDEELNNIIVNKLSNNDANEKLIDLISYTHHPVPLSNEAKDKEDQINLQFMLTKKEKRSLKKIYQEQKRKDIQEKIKLGLMKPKENKLKYSNMIQLFKNDSIINPSQVYQTVQNSYKEREKKMLEENAKNALTKEQKKLKFKSKIEKDQERGIYGYFLRVNKIYDIGNCNRFNSWIKIFCKKYKLSGFLVHFFKQKENFIYLEGGQKALNKIHKRIGNKLKIEENNLKKKEEKKEIKENKDCQENKKEEKKKNENKNKNYDNNKEEQTQEDKNFSCILKWKGMVKKKNFGNFQIIIKQNLQEFIEYLVNNQLIYLYNNIK